MKSPKLHQYTLAFLLPVGLSGMVLTHAVGTVLGFFLLGVGASVAGLILLIMTAASLLRVWQKLMKSSFLGFPIMQGIGDWGIMMLHILGLVAAVGWNGVWFYAPFLVFMILCSYILMIRTDYVISRLKIELPHKASEGV